MKHIPIRPASDDDGDAIAVLIAGAFAEYEGCVFDRAAEFPELDAIASYFRNRGGIIWVAELDGVVVGSLATAPSQNADAPPGAWEIFKVYVAQSARRRGLARALYAKALAHAQAVGACELRLWTDTKFVDAHRFYESCGFTRAGEPRPLHDLSSTFEYPYRMRIVPVASTSEPADTHAPSES